MSVSKLVLKLRFLGWDAGTVTISQNTTQLITIFMIPLSIVMILYAMLTYTFRSKYLQQKKVQYASSLSPSDCQHA